MRRVVLLALLAGCAHSRGREPVMDEPSWKSTEGRVEARVEMARVLLDAGQNDAVLGVVAQARQEGAASSDLDLLQARALHAKGALQEALDLLVPQLVREGRNAEWVAEIGLLQYDQGRIVDAEKTLARAVQLAPGDPRMHNNLGFLLLVIHRDEEAVRELQESLRLDPTQQKTRNNLGSALVALDREDEAFRTFRAGDSEARSMASMGLAWERVGKTERATSWYQRALKVDPSQTVALARLEAIGGAVPSPEKKP